MDILPNCLKKSTTLSIIYLLFFGSFMYAFGYLVGTFNILSSLAIFVLTFIISTLFIIIPELIRLMKERVKTWK